MRIKTVQGVGDIFWAYQKLAPYVDEIDVVILILRHDEVQRRALGFVQLLPKVRAVEFELVSNQSYHAVASRYWPLAKVLEGPDGATVHYAVNAMLEEGRRLEAFDPGRAPQWGVPLLVPDERFLDGDYVAAYVSGNKHDSSWGDAQWSRFISEATRRTGVAHHRLVLLGAGYDAQRLWNIARQLHEAGHGRVELLVDQAPADAVRVLRDARLFIGYQSGLNVIADNYDVPQVMVYFPHLRRMLNTWCKPGHAESGLFRAFTFDQPAQQILASLTPPPRGGRGQNFRA